MSGVKNDEDMNFKATVAKPSRAPNVTRTRTLAMTPGITPSMTPRRMNEKIWVSIYHYCNKEVTATVLSISCRS